MADKWFLFCFLCLNLYISVLYLRIDYSSACRMKSEFHVPFARPCLEEQQLTVGCFLKQHFLQAYHGSTTAVTVGCPVIARVPEGWEALRPVGKFLKVKACRIVGKAEACSPDVVLFPADVCAHL